MITKNYRHFAPQKEVEYLTITVDGKKMRECVPYVGDARNFIDNVKRLRGISVSHATAKEIRRGGFCTKLHKRVTNAFEKAWQASLVDGKV